MRTKTGFASHSTQSDKHRDQDQRAKERADLREQQACAVRVCGVASNTSSVLRSSSPRTNFAPARMGQKLSRSGKTVPIYRKVIYPSGVWRA